MVKEVIQTVLWQNQGGDKYAHMFAIQKDLNVTTPTSSEIADCLWLSA